MNKFIEFDPSIKGIISLTAQRRPNIWGRIKIYLWNMVLFPIVEIKWEEEINHPQP